MTAYIQTVLGPVEPEALGVTHTHEHILSDLSNIAAEPDDPFERELFHAPMRMDILGYLSYYHVANLDNLRLDDIDTAIAEIDLYKRHGGGAIVEASSIGLSRNPEGLTRVSRATGVHIVMGSSYYVKETHPPDMGDISEDDIFEEIVRDITVGVGSTGIRAGIIGEVGCSYPLSDNERKVLRASAKAQRATGAAILIHPGRDEPSPEEIIEVIVDAGGDPGRTIIGHLDRTVMERQVLLRIAEAGLLSRMGPLQLRSSILSAQPQDHDAERRGPRGGDRVHDRARLRRQDSHGPRRGVEAQADGIRRAGVLLHNQAGGTVAEDAGVYRW